MKVTSLISNWMSACGRKSILKKTPRVNRSLLECAREHATAKTCAHINFHGNLKRYDPIMLCEIEWLELPCCTLDVKQQGDEKQSEAC